MSNFPYPFEIHIHGQVQLCQNVHRKTVLSTLAPLWQYASIQDVERGMRSFYDDEPGIEFEDGVCLLSFCWTTQAGEDFREVISEVCLGLNELALVGAALEVSVSDVEYDSATGSDDEDDEEGNEIEPRDDLLLFFIGPTPESILQIQRDVLVQDVLALMDRHFERAELSPVVEVVRQLFDSRIREVNTMLDTKTLGSETLSKLFSKSLERNNHRKLH